MLATLLLTLYLACVLTLVISIGIKAWQFYWPPRQKAASQEGQRRA